MSVRASSALRVVVACATLLCAARAFSADRAARPALKAPSGRAFQVPVFDPKRRKMLEPAPNPEALRAYFSVSAKVQAERELDWRTYQSNPRVQRDLELEREFAPSLQRLTDLDPNHKLIPRKELSALGTVLQVGGRLAVAKRGDGPIEMQLRDWGAHVTEARQLEMKAQGKLARMLAHELKDKEPSPGQLEQVTRKLAVDYPYLANLFKVEMLIADNRELFPTLARWDFRVDDERGRRARPLPADLQEAVEKVGYRAFANANVLFSDHLYKDALLTMDALTSLGLKPENARFVATPYPFEPTVKQAMQDRGVKTAMNPYSARKTAQAVDEALAALVKRSEANGGPILVYDDGGVATKIILEKYSSELGRFRIIEITKDGERVAKTLFKPRLLDEAEHNAIRMYDEDEAAIRKRYVAATSWDRTSREAAEREFAEIGKWPYPSGHIDPDQVGFAHYTYSDSAHKRQVMTPLYAEQVNRATFEAIEEGGRKLINQRVTIIGGGAMGLSAGRELRAKGFEVTFVEPSPSAELLNEGFPVASPEAALPGRGLILEMSGARKIFGIGQLSSLDSGTVVVQGSSKNNPFDMEAIGKIASERVPWPTNARGQRSATYKFKVLGQTKEIHFPGDGYTISMGGAQNVPIAKFVPEIRQLTLLGVHALNERPVTRFPFFSTPENLAEITENK